MNQAARQLTGLRCGTFELKDFDSPGRTVDGEQLNSRRLVEIRDRDRSRFRQIEFQLRPQATVLTLQPRGKGLLRFIVRQVAQILAAVTVQIRDLSERHP